MYYPDLSPYKTEVCEKLYHTISVGWLDHKYPYTKGQVSEEFLNRLWIYCKFPVYLSFGYHACDFCHKEFGVLMRRHNEDIALGSAEIRVIGNDMVAYAAPDMIYHYIVDHGYVPPKEFIDAVIESKLPYESEEYQNRYKKL